MELCCLAEKMPGCGQNRGRGESKGVIYNVRGVIDSQSLNTSNQSLAFNDWESMKL